jgi:predicted dinucleotide-binding enzyme
MPTGLRHRVAIVGTGPIGSALAGHLILAGNKVTIGARRPDAFTPPDYQREDIDYPLCTIEEAIEGAEVAILAIPNAAPPGRVPDAAVWHSRQPASDAGDKRVTDRPRKVFR